MEFVVILVPSKYVIPLDVCELLFVPPLDIPRGVARVSAPVDEKVDVALPPKYALANTDRFVDDAATGNTTRFGSESVGVVPPLDVI